MIFNTGYNFQNIRDIIDAAENLQSAGKDEDCQKIITDLAKDLLKEVKGE